MPTLSHAGVTLHYLDEGQGPTVLLLHAFPLSGEMFRPQLAALSGRYRLLVPDHRGFGQSTFGTGPTLMEDLAADALALLDALSLPTAVVGGVSMGGYAAMALLRAAPSRVRALVLADTQATADDDAGKARREQTAREVLEGGMEVLVESMLPKLLAAEASAEDRHRVASLIRKSSPQGAAAALRGMAARTDSRELLSRFSGPALVAVGEEDVLTPVAKARELASLLHGSTLAEVPGAGHLANLEQPQAFNRALAGFLDRL